MSTMKRYFLLTLCLILLAGLAWSPLKSSAETDRAADDEKYACFAGRLYIPDVGIDVALYRSNEQYVVDRKDSAAYFDLPRWPEHMIAADHNTQDFGALHNVTVGMEAYIVHKDSTTTHYICVEVFDGHNTGKAITDLNGNVVMDKADLLMYTCRNGWRNVRVCLWDVVVVTWDEPEENNTGDGK